MINDILNGNLDGHSGFFAGGARETVWEAGSSGKGLASAVIWAPVSKGVPDLNKDWNKMTEGVGGTLLNIVGEWFNFFDDTDAASEALDEETGSRTVAYLRRTNDPADPRPLPSILAIYFTGTDHSLHEMGDTTISTHLYDATDDELGEVLKELQRQNVFDKAKFIVVSDHGHTPIKKDEANFLCLIDPGTILWPFPDSEMAEVLESVDGVPKYNVLAYARSDPDFPNRASLDVPSSFNAVAALNGGMAHIYLKNRGTDKWQDAPRWEEDVLATAERFRRNHLSGVDEGEMENALKAILVRNGLSGDYEVYRLDTGASDFTTPAQRLANIQSLADYFNVAANKPSVLGTSAEAVSEIANLNHKYSGDLILLANGDAADKNARHAFGRGSEASTHGYFNDSDFKATLLGGSPLGTDAELTALQATISGKSKVKETYDIVKELLGL